MAVIPRLPSAGPDQNSDSDLPIPKRRPATPQRPIPDDVERLRQNREQPSNGDPYKTNWGGQYGSDTPGHYGGQYGSDTPGHYSSDDNNDDQPDTDNLDVKEQEPPYDRPGNEPENQTEAPQPQFSPADRSWRDRLGLGGRRGEDRDKLGKAEKEPAATGGRAAKSSSAIPAAERLNYRPTAESGGKSKNLLRALVRTRRRRIGLGIGLGVGGGFITLFLLFFPNLRLESYLAKINQRVFAGAETAVTNRMENLTERYMITHILNLNSCGNVRDVNCRAVYSKMGLAGSLFTAWRDASVEQKIIKRFGLTIESVQNAQLKEKFIIRSSATGKTFRLTDGHLQKGQFFGGDRAMGREVNKFLREETKWNQVLQRHSVRKYLARKHGVKFWCFFACKTRDNIDSKFRDAKTRLKYRLVERVIYPFSPKLGFIMDCLINYHSSRCSAKSLRERGIDRTNLTDQEIENLQNRVRENPNLGLGGNMLQNLLEKVMSQQAARATVSAIPVAGQVYLGLVIVDALERINECLDDYCLSKYAADLNSRQYLEYYTAMRSASDELKPGDLALPEVGALMDEFQSDHPAEESLIYQASANPDKPVTSLVSNKKELYVCADSKPIPSGELVCPEKKIARTFKIEEIRNNNFVDGIEHILNVYARCPVPEIFGNCPPPAVRPKTVIRPLLDTINWAASTVLGPLIDVVFKGVKLLPGVGEVLSYVGGKFEAIIQAVMTKLFPLPIQVNSQGRENYDGLWAGGLVAASEFDKGGYTADGEGYGLGGKKLNSKELGAIYQEYLAQQDYNYQHSGLLTKLGSLDYPNSLANRFIAAMPSSFSQVPQRLFGSLPNMFSSLFSFNRLAYAQETVSVEDAFGIPANGYTMDDPAITRDPSELTEDFCKQAKEAWLNSKTEDPITGFDEYSVTNPCLLEEVAVETGSGVYTGKVNPDGIVSASTSFGTGQTGSLPVGDTAALRAQVAEFVKQGKISFSHSNDTAAVGTGYVIRETVEQRGEQVVISDNVWRLMIYLVNRGFSFNVTSMVGTHSRCSSTGNCPSQHWIGEAIDVGTINGAHIVNNPTQAIPAIIGFMKALQALPQSQAPRQVLAQGVGGSTYVPAIDNLSISGGVSDPGYTSDRVGGHMDHVHVGVSSK